MPTKNKPLEAQILDFLRTKSSDPSALCTATARAFIILTKAAIKMSGNDPDNVRIALAVLDKMKQSIIAEFGNPESE